MANNNHFGENNRGVQVGTNEGSITFNQSQTEQEIDRLCLRNLRCPDSWLVKNILKESKDKLRRESFEWILQDPKYKAWRDGEEVCLLWIKGGAGKGKTMISIGLIEELLQFCKENSNAITYFFCQDANSELNTLASMMKGLILQLINQRPALKECLRSRWNTTQSSFSQDLTSWRALWYLLLEMIDQCGCSKTYLVVDALDECQGGDVNEFLKVLVMNGLHRSGVKWLLTSRPLDSAERTLLAGYDQAQMSLELESVHLSKAVRSYITNKVNELSHKMEYERHLKEEVESQLLQRSEETFLWVSMVCKRLEDVPPHEALAVIQNMPHGLRALYEQAFKHLSRGKTKKTQMCMQLLKVMMLAYRPLRMAEFAAVLGVEDGLDVNLMSLIIRCASFLRLQGHSVEFAHQSARDFLAEKNQQLKLDSHQIFGHYDIAMNCISYLSRSLKVNLLRIPPSANLRRIEVLKAENKSHLLNNLEYAAIFWGQHVRDSDIFHSRNLSKASIIEFLYAKLLEWLECLGLLDMVSVAVVTLQRVENLFKGESTPLSFVNESILFLSRHLYIVENWPLQVYASAAIWSPKSSALRKRNLDRVPWLRSVAPLDTAWGPRTLIFPREVDNQVESKISSDSRLMAAVCERFDSELSSIIYIWDIATGVMQWELCSESTQSIRKIAFSQDNKNLIWISRTNAVHSWEMSSDDVHSILVEFPEFGENVVLSSDGTQVASIVSNHEIFIWDTSTGQVRVNIRSNYPLNDQKLFFSLNDTQIMCDASEWAICIWDTTSGRLQKKLVKPPDFRHCLAHSSDGIHVAYHSPGAEVFFWNTISGHAKQLGHCSYSEEKLMISPDFKTISCKTDYLVKFWNFTGDEILEDSWPSIHSGKVMKLAFSPNGKLCVSLTYHGEICPHSMLSLPERIIAPKYFGSLGLYKPPIDVAFSYDGTRVVCCGRRGDNFAVLDTKTGATQKTIPVPVDREGLIQTARFLPGDKSIAVGMGSLIMLFELASGTCQSQIKAGNTVSMIAPSPDGNYLAGIVRGNEIRIWNMRTKSLVVKITDHRMRFRCLTFSPEGKRIASYAYMYGGESPRHSSRKNDPTLNIWDISRSLNVGKVFGSTLSSRILKRPTKIKSELWGFHDVLKFSVDGQYLLSNHDPIEVRDTDTGCEVETVTTKLPLLYLDVHGSNLDMWIFCENQPFINLRTPFVPIDQFRLDVQGERIVIEYGNRKLLILDIDTKVLRETFESATSV